MWIAHGKNKLSELSKVYGIRFIQVCFHLKKWMWITRKWLSYFVSRFVCNSRTIINASSNPQLVCNNTYKQSIAVIKSDKILTSKRKLMFNQNLISRSGKILSSKSVVINYLHCDSTQMVVISDAKLQISVWMFLSGWKW